MYKTPFTVSFSADDSDNLTFLLFGVTKDNERLRLNIDPIKLSLSFSGQVLPEIVSIYAEVVNTFGEVATTEEACNVTKEEESNWQDIYQNRKQEIADIPDKDITEEARLVKRWQSFQSITVSANAEVRNEASQNITLAKE